MQHNKECICDRGMTNSNAMELVINGSHCIVLRNLSKYPSPVAYILGELLLLLPILSRQEFILSNCGLANSSCCGCI